MSVFDDLQKEINQVVGGGEAQPELTHYCCQECGTTYQCAKPPVGCNFCKKEGAMQWPGNTEQVARKRAIRAAGVVSSKKTEEPKAEEPEAEKPRAEAPKAEKPKRQRRVVKKEEKVKTDETAKPEPEPESEILDYREQREKAIREFIENKGLNEISPVTVGTAVVQTVGFTIWVDRQPIFRLMQPFESPADFQRAYDEARAEQPALQIDCCQCSQVDNPELAKVIFKGDLIASTNNGNGTQWVRRGDKVTLGAYKTKSDHIRFVVLEVKA